MKQVSTKVISNIEVMQGGYLIWLESPEIATIVKPGQFVMVCCGEETILPRPLSIHQCNGTNITIFFNAVGAGTSWLSRRETNDKLNIFGPLGNGFSIYPGSQNLLLVAGGMGIAPLFFLAEDSLKKGKSVILLYGTANNQRYSFPLDIKIVAATEDGTVGYQGMVTDLLPEYVRWADQIFTCGPIDMYRNMAQMSGLSNKPVQVSLEVRMGCGRGVCYGCTIKTRNGQKRVCEDGPVFNLDDILWDELNY